MARILIIDDSSFMRNRCAKILDGDGHEILEAADGLKGLQMATTNPPDCIVMDIIMPGIDGLKVLKTLRDQGSTVPVIILTADIQQAVHAQCLELGANAVITKPPKKEELQDKIIEILACKEETK